MAYAFKLGLLSFWISTQALLGYLEADTFPDDLFFSSG
jgi:hypothetical protein